MASPDRLRSTVASFLAKPAPIDWLLAATFTLAGELEVVLRLPGVANEWELDAAGALALLGLAWWRRQPLVPSILLAGSAVGSVAAGARTPMVVPQLAFFVATYALGAYARNLELGLGAALPALAGLAIDVLLPHPPVNVLSGLVWYLVFVTAAPILIGRLVRSRSQLLERLKQQRTALLAAGEAGAREAVIAERQSISRQLRQVVASCVESVLADVAVVEADRGAKGLTSLVRIESVARWALAEMRRLLEGLRLPDAETLPGPDPPPIPKPLDDAEPNHAFATARAVQKALGSAPWPVALAVLTLAWFEAGVLPMVPVHTSRLLVGVCLIGVAAPIAWSRTRPLASAALSLLALALISRLLVPIPSSGASAVLAIYLPVAVAVFGAGRQAWVGLAICSIGFIGAFGILGAPILVFVAGSWLAGRLLGERTRLARELDAANRSLARERDLRAYQLVVEERLRVTRDLHDVIGHTLTALVLQAGSARRNWAVDRDRASRAIASLAGVAREGLSELLASLQALDSNSSPPWPIPGLADIDALVGRARAAGVRVELSLDAEPATLSPELELTAYRVVQEGLTNVMKYAPRCRTQVRIQARDGRLRVEVINSRPTAPHPSAGSGGGQGLPGMAQRVAAGGGELSWGRSETGGFAVRARLPIRS